MTRSGITLRDGFPSSNRGELPIHVGELPEIPTLEYLGVGYDEIARLKMVSKEAVDQNTPLDENYKGPILLLVYPTGGKRRYNNTMQWELPKNVYAWSSPSCELLENTMERDDKLASDYHVDGKVNTDVIDFSSNLSAKGKSGKASSANRRQIKESCTTIIAGTWLNYRSKFTESFLSAVKLLIRKLNDEKTCSLKNYGLSECNRALDYWFEFFHNYGTHVITRIVLGGKLDISSDIKENSTSESSDINASLNMQHKDVDLHANVVMYKGAKNTGY
ncbi:hypothetical protein BgAZ_206590 [Babesia gibsoni]|uniref:MACPF domain-containing protein n=1 Tax=Babesia gibsoni TaxID=33632 RepID=A0AAD8PEB9_BABGI|nr:hypothetical protein BgAZ_206590 [Babesia gibsoni]